tara:strand:- start:52279 stop:52701 length:423 start_codon:yes stop_codon:yes gene_type:complete
MSTKYGALGATVKGETDRVGFTLTFLSRQLAEAMDFVSSGSRNVSAGFNQYFRNVESGYIYGKPNPPRNSKKDLERLAILLHALNFSERHPEIIEGVRELDDRFEYPPPEDDRVPYTQLMEAYEAENGGSVPEESLDARV